MSFIDLTNKVFGRLTVVRREGTSAGGKAIWLCRCSCGEHSRVIGTHLRSGNTTSCGCLKRDVAQQLATRHGLSGSAEYRAWRSMRDRCENEHGTAWPYYGGRGITVCERWRNSVEAFCSDMGPRPSPQHTVDRIDANGNYEPSNCRWATRSEQMNNIRNNRVVAFRGREQTLTQWARETCLNREVIRWRLRAGWSIERALSTPSITKRNAAQREDRP